MTIILCTEEIQNRTHSCFKRYLRSKILGEPLIDAVAPLLKSVQDLLSHLERFPLLLDMLEMDPFMLQKARPAGVLQGPLYSGIYYTHSGIEPPCQKVYSNTNAVDLHDELIKLQNPDNEERKLWFKKFYSKQRRQMWVRYLQNLILLNLVETAIYGYSTRDGRDFAIKLVVIAMELQPLAESVCHVEYFAYYFSLAELQLRRLDRLEGMTISHKLTD